MIIPVVFSTSHTFIMPTAVTIKSMLMVSTDCKCDISILQSPNVTEYDRNKLKAIVEPYNCPIKFISVGKVFDGMYETRGIVNATYYRLLIPWLIPQYDKIVNVDSDMIFKESVKKLYDLAQDDQVWTYGVNCPGFRTEKFKIYSSKYGLDPLTYVNGGMQVINSKVQRDLNLDSVYKSYFKNKYQYLDQDILNIVCQGHIGLLPENWNYPVFSLLNPELRKEMESFKPSLIHYAGPKPWETLTPFWLDWWRVCYLTEFFTSEQYLKIERQYLDPPGTYSTELLLKIMLRNKFPNLYDKLVKLIHPIRI